MSIWASGRRLLASITISSLQARLLALVFVAIIPTVGLIFYSAEEGRNDATATAHREALTLAEVATSRQQQLVEQTRQLLSFVVKQPFVQFGNALTCRSYLAELLLDYPQYTSIAVADLEGDVYCSTSPLPSPVNVSEQPHFQRAVLTGGFTVGDYRVNQDNGEAALPLGYPVTDEENNIKGVAFAALDLGWLSRLAASARLPSNSTLTVLDVNGKVLARYPDPELWVGRSITGLPLAETIFTSQEQGTGNVLDLNGEEQLFGFARLNDPTQSGEAYVAVGISKAVAYGPANLALRRNLIGLGITAVTALGIVWFGIEMFIVNQIRQLVAGTQRLASGDLKFRIRARQSKGELGRLATAFDQMAQQLEERESQRIQLEEERSRRMRSEIMLTEIQHRVKNSLQIAASLISLQASKLGESQSKLALQESESRIRTIAGIYGKLQIRDGTPAVDFGSFLKDTLAPLVGARAGPGRVNLQITADSILLDSEKAVPYALIANELVINCLKHAFTDGRIGTIDVAIRKVGPEGFVLTVSDDGVGFPEDLDFRSTQSLGLQVVNALVDQLHGSISLDRNGGTTFRIEFSKSPERAS